MDQKTQFVSEYLRDTISFTELYDRYGISRKTDYKWINRYQAEVSRLITGKVAATPQSIARFQAAINTLENEKIETAEILSKAKQAIRKTSPRKFAAQAEIDPTNLNKTISGERRPSAEMLAKLQQVLMKIVD